MLSLAIIGLYTVPIFTNIAPNGLFGIQLVVALAAGATALTSLLFYFITPKNPNFVEPLTVYLLFAATSALLVIQTGGASSPFIMLWTLTAFFGGIFALYGGLPIIIATAIFVAAQYLDHKFNANLVAVVMLSSIVPAILGMVIWRKRADNDEDRSVKKMASELSEVANRSEIVINAIGDGVIAIDSLGVIQLINPAAQEILGWGKQDALMLNYKSILQLTDMNNAAIEPQDDPIQQVLNTNQQLRSKTLVLVTKSGKKITTSLVISPIGEPGAGIITVFRDMTKEKAEEREQAEFISTASHEMRTPVASIEGYLGLALNPNTATIDAKARDFIMKAHEAAQHLGRLFQDLLDVSKSEDGRMANLPKVIDITPFAETIVQGLQEKAAEKSLILTFIPTSARAQKTITPVYFVNQDNDHIREVLDNLIENAIKYTPSGEVTVNVTGSDDKVIVSVTDSGLGIPSEDLPHLFQKFYRVDNADRQQIGGTGLGLYLSRRLAEAMEGRLWVESVHGKGSTFFLELPRVSGQDVEALKAQQSAQAQRAAAASAAAPQPVADAMPPVVTPRYAQPQQSEVPQQAAPAAQPADPGVKAATTVPRGESLSREQIAAHVARLRAMAQEMQTAPAGTEPPTQPPVQPPTPPQA